MATPLGDGDIVRELATIPDWKRDGKQIARRYDFRAFLTAVEFVNRVAVIAESRNHHPFIAIDYKHVTLRLTTWHAGGLTAQDFDEARSFDAVGAELAGQSRA